MTPHNDGFRHFQHTQPSKEVAEEDLHYQIRDIIRPKTSQADSHQ
jgi:hypothetical protein